MDRLPDETVINPRGIELYVWHFERDLFFYRSCVSWVIHGAAFGMLKFSIDRKLDPLSYWLIQLIHGIGELERMARSVPEEYFKDYKGESGK